MPVNGETIPEQVGYIQKHTDNADLTEDFVSPIEQTTTFNEKQHKKEIAKSKVEIEEMATGKKEAKPSIQVKVKLFHMRSQAKSKLNLKRISITSSLILLIQFSIYFIGYIITWKKHLKLFIYV